MNRRTRFNGNSQQTSHSRRQTQVGGGNRRRSDEHPREQDSGRRNNLPVSHLATSRSDDKSVHAHGSHSQTPPLQQRPLDAAENHGNQTEFDFTAQAPDSESVTTFTEDLRAAQVKRRTQLFDADKKSVILTNEDCHILNLPDDVLFLILSFLQPAELCQAGCVCRRFHYLTTQDTVWLQHARRTAVVKPLSAW